jgi:transcriptional regulator NrdR family protein
MRCPICGWKVTHIMQTRDGDTRQRECCRCKSKWWTVEVLAMGFPIQNNLHKGLWKKGVEE